MMRLHLRALFGVVAVVALATNAQAADYAGHRHRHHGIRASIGTCVRTRVETIGSPAPGAATAIFYRDGVVQAFDDGLLGHTESLPGDPIQLCLVSFSRDCGGVFSRDLQPGRTYATGNLRTGAAWTLPDIRSSCARP